MQIGNVKRGIIRVAVSLVIVAFVARYFNSNVPALTVSQVRIEWLLVSVIAVLVSFWIRAYRWRQLLKADRIVGIADLYLLSFTGTTLNLILPGSLGDIAKSYYAYRKTGLKEEILSSILLDKFVGLASVFILGAVASLIYQLYTYAYLSLVLAIFFFAFSFFPRILPWGFLKRLESRILRNRFNVERIHEAFLLPSKKKISALLLSILSWVVTYLVFYQICLAFSANVGLIYVFAIAPLITIARLAPMTFSGLGTQEAMVVYLFSTVGIDTGKALVISLSFTVISVLLPGLLGLFIIWKMRL